MLPCLGDLLQMLPKSDWQRSLWLLCEEPDSSLAARIFAVVSVFCILVSVVNFCMETLPSFERPVCINVTQTSPVVNRTYLNSSRDRPTNDRPPVGGRSL